MNLMTWNTGIKSGRAVSLKRRTRPAAPALRCRVGGGGAGQLYCPGGRTHGARGSCRTRVGPVGGLSPVRPLAPTLWVQPWERPTHPAVSSHRQQRGPGQSHRGDRQPRPSASGGDQGSASVTAWRCPRGARLMGQTVIVQGRNVHDVAALIALLTLMSRATAAVRARPTASVSADAGDAFTDFHSNHRTSQQ